MDSDGALAITAALALAVALSRGWVTGLRDWVRARSAGGDSLLSLLGAAAVARLALAAGKGIAVAPGGGGGTPGEGEGSGSGDLAPPGGEPLPGTEPLPIEPVPLIGYYTPPTSPPLTA